MRNVARTISQLIKRPINMVIHEKASAPSILVCTEIPGAHRRFLWRGPVWSTHYQIVDTLGEVIEGF